MQLFAANPLKLSIVYNSQEKINIPSHQTNFKQC